MKNNIAGILIAALIFADSVLSFADEVVLKAIVPKTSSYNIPRTGQTASYKTYDDGYYRKGAPSAPAAQYTDNGDNTVTDNGTGLMWIKNPASVIVGSYYLFTAKQKWADDIDYITGYMNVYGYPPGKLYKDWRMPNIKELLSIVKYGSYPATDSIFGWQTGTGSHYNYWSSTTYLPSTGSAYVVHFDVGTVEQKVKTNVDDAMFVRPVRGGEGGLH
ncbi:MAG: DUF1566 domain-containing protein [Candidatus Omnitrophota bacterium]